MYYAIELGGTNVELDKQVLAGVNSASASVDAARSIANGTASTPAAPAAPAVLPLNLAATTDTDTLVGTSGDDRFTATHLTLSTLDSIDGGAGIDTFEYVDASTTLNPLSDCAGAERRDHQYSQCEHGGFWARASFSDDEFHAHPRTDA
ncbi:hypothetical protein FXN63_24525 [Pigmentiphaga aceris]|uniref:Uncharacterized protein n=1 Tax=Pigmentiphaga aceris TaxID=1940612 RepID=A0A5C0B470_9BURK|nr:hypothetical protein [Pigmentiphaga aceris]QEI08656.1 hypothetical protein FXN63_24525 [Pigmentiphaga aceris]